MRSSVLHLAAIFSLCLLSVAASSEAEACEAGAEAHVTFAIRTIGAEAPTDDVTVNYHVLPYVASTDGGTTDPCDDDPSDPACDFGGTTDPCDDDPSDPACDSGGATDPCDDDPSDPLCAEVPEEPTPVSGSLQVSWDGTEIFELPAGEGDFEFVLPGYETTVVHRSICGETSVRVTLMSDAASTFSAYVSRWDGQSPAEGAQLTLRGQNERIGEKFEAAVDADGQIQMEGIPAGMYALEAWLPLGNSHEILELEGIEILQDVHLSIRLRSSVDRPSYRVTCASVDGFTTAWGANTLWLWMMVFGALVVLRTRYDDK